MVAITTTPRLPAHHRPTLRLVPPAGARRGVGEVVAAGVALLVVFAAVLYLLQAPPTATAGQIPVSDATHVVADGDTMWSIAVDVAPAGEAAAYVERLVEVNGTAIAVPGDVLALPVP